MPPVPVSPRATKTRYAECRERRTQLSLDRKMKMKCFPRATRNRLSNVVLLCATSLVGPAIAGEKPPVISDAPSALTTTSRVSATIDFGLPSIASAIERDVPKRLARCVFAAESSSCSDFNSRDDLLAGAFEVGFDLGFESVPLRLTCIQCASKAALGDGDR